MQRVKQVPGKSGESAKCKQNRPVLVTLTVAIGSLQASQSQLFQLPWSVGTVKWKSMARCPPPILAISSLLPHRNSAICPDALTRLFYKGLNNKALTTRRRKNMFIPTATQGKPATGDWSKNWELRLMPWSRQLHLPHPGCPGANVRQGNDGNLSGITLHPEYDSDNVFLQPPAIHVLETNKLARNSDPWSAIRINFGCMGIYDLLRVWNVRRGTNLEIQRKRYVLGGPCFVCSWKTALDTPTGSRSY